MRPARSADKPPADQPPAGPQAVRFSTSDFPERDRREGWREIVGRAIMNVEIEPLPDNPFFAEMTLRRLPGLYMSTGVVSAMEIRHTAALIDSDDLVIHLSFDGEFVVRQHGRELALGKGGAVLMTCAEPHVAVSSAMERFCLFRVPMCLMSPVVGDLDAALVKPIAHDSEALGLLANYAGGLQNMPELDKPKVRDLAATHLRDLIALALGATDDAAELAKNRGVRAARLNAIKADIAEHIGSGNLSVREIAVRHQVTPRYVQRLFEAEGTTFSEFVLEQRLVRAHRLLTDARLDGRRIISVALDAGFRDLSYFNRTFRRRFGATPSDVRAAALGYRDAR